MDPNATLVELLDLARQHSEHDDMLQTVSIDAMESDIERMSELVIALHGWIEKGGFLPKMWDRTIAA